MRTRLTILFTCLVVAGVAAGCGGNGAPGAAVSTRTLKLAAQNSTEATSSRFMSRVSIDVAGERVEISMHGMTSADGERVSIIAELPGYGSLEERIVDGVLYMDLGGIADAARELPPGKRWVAVDVASLAGLEAGALKSLSDQAHDNTPQQGLASLKALTGDVEDLGDDTVAGSPARHYRGTIDFALLANDTAGLPSTATDALASLGDAGRVPVDVWVDGADRVVKMQFVLRIPDGPIGLGGEVAFTMEITEFGVPVDIEAPPADEVVGYDELTSTQVI